MRLFLVIVAGLIFSPFLVGQEAKDVKGVVHAVNTVHGTITLLIPDVPKANRVQTFNLFKPDLPVLDPRGGNLSLSDIRPDQRVLLKIVDEDVSAIHVASPTLYGTLTKVDVANRTVMMTTKFGEKIFVIPADTPIIENKQETQFLKLRPGTPTLLCFSLDKKNILELKTGHTVYPINRLSREIGHLMEIDRDKRTVQVLLSHFGGDTQVLRTLNLTRDASFALMFHDKPHRELPIEEITRAVRVSFWLDTLTSKVAHLDLDMPTAGRRLIKAIDLAKGLLVLEDHEGEMTLNLSPNMKVMTDHGPARREDIQPKMYATCALGLDRQTVEILILARN